MMIWRRSGPATAALLLSAVAVVDCGEEQTSGTVEAPTSQPSPAADAAPPAIGTPVAPIESR